MQIKIRKDMFVMQLRTDLALEAREQHPDYVDMDIEEMTEGDVKISRMKVPDENTARHLKKAMGSYVTMEMPPLTDHSFLPDHRYEIISREIRRLLPKNGTVLTVGLGNSAITPDALGPRTAAQVLATRHVTEELKKSADFSALRSAAVTAPGVLGQTGIEVLDLLRALCGALRPSAVIAVDAMASLRLSRLGCTVQISDAGISPGAGVGNNRPSISGRELGVPVIAVGVPTVVEAATLVSDLVGGGEEPHTELSRRSAGMIVTPKEIDLLIDRAARLLALSINHALHPSLDPIELLAVAGG